MGTVSDELNLVSVRRGLSTSSSSDFISDSPKNDLISKSKKKILVKRRNGQNRGLELNLKHKNGSSKIHQEQIVRVAASLFVLCWLLALTWLTFSMKEEREQADLLKSFETGGDNQSEKMKVLENRIIILEKRLMTLEETLKEKEPSTQSSSISVSTSTSTLNPPSILNSTLPLTPI